MKGDPKGGPSRRWGYFYAKTIGQFQVIRLELIIIKLKLPRI